MSQSTLPYKMKSVELFFIVHTLMAAIPCNNGNVRAADHSTFVNGSDTVMNDVFYDVQVLYTLIGDHVQPLYYVGTEISKPPVSLICSLT